MNIRLNTFRALSKTMFLGTIIALLSLQGCDAPKRAAGTPLKTNPPSGNGNTKPPTNTNGTTQPGTNQPGTSGNNGGKKPTERQTYRIALVLPFLTNQLNTTTESVPEKSQFALQFYAGMQVAFAEMAGEQKYPNLVVEVLDSKGTDAEFESVLSNPRLQQSQVVIGPSKSGQVSRLAEVTKANRQILISPETPTAELTTNNPGFVQINPSLRTHCTKIIQHLRVRQKMAPEQIILVCKQNEAMRLPYLQDPNLAIGGAALQEVIVPDASTNFDKIDFKKYIKANRTTAFVMPSWAGQDWIIAFLSRLKATKGSNRVEVYGMPQWIKYEQLEPDFLTDLNVHITTASYIDPTDEQVIAFQKKFFEMFGALPNADAFNGYDVAYFTATMLSQNGLSFPEKMAAQPSFFATTQGGIYCRKAKGTGVADGSTAYDYIENIYVQLLRFEKFRFVPVEE